MNPALVRCSDLLSMGEKGGLCILPNSSFCAMQELSIRLAALATDVRAHEAAQSCRHMSNMLEVPPQDGTSQLAKWRRGVQSGAHELPVLFPRSDSCF